MLQYYYTGDLGNVIAGLRGDFGREQTLEQHVSGRRVVFYKATKPEWTDMKLDLELVAMSNDDKHVVFITCYGKKNIDFLAPTSETAPKIKQYFDAIFPKEK